MLFFVADGGEPLNRLRPAAVNAPMTEAEGGSIRPNRSMGTEGWVRRSAGMFGRESTLREPGGPR